MLLIGLMWLPFVVICYPGLATGDSFDELSQYFHQDTSWSLDSVNLLNEDVYITKHHSVFHTVVMGFIYQVGRELVSFTFGAFIYTFLQIILLLSIFAFMIRYMNRIKVNYLIILFSILFIGLNPVVYTYAMCAVKDTPSAIFNLLYVIFLFQIVRNYDSIFNNKFRLVMFLITIMLVLLLRNNGIYTFLLSFPCLFFVYKKYWKKILLTLLIPLVLFGLYDKVLLPRYDISDSSIKEMLSIPVMQVARTIRYKKDEFEEEDIEIINTVFDFDEMGHLYNPDISDNVKDLYNKNSTKSELMSFFGVWFKYLKKYPSIYIESFVNSTYSYFFPGKNRDILYLNGYKFWNPSYFDISSPSVFFNARIFGNELLSIYYKLPCFMNNVAYYDWILILSCIYIIIKKKYKYLVPLMPLLAILLSCLASPLNGSFRYILPIVFSLPIILSIDYLVYKECKEDNF